MLSKILKTMMRHNIYTSKPLRISGLKLIGGGKALNISVLRHSLISLSFLFIVSFLCLACSKETSRMSYPEMQAYYAESCNLGVAASDSIARFRQKVDTFVTQHTDAKDDPLYPKIQANIESVWVRVRIELGDDWSEDYNMIF